MIGGRGAANQKGAPHARAPSFKRRAEGRAGAEGSGRGEVPAWAGRHGSRRDPRGDWPARGFLVLNQSTGRTSWRFRCARASLGRRSASASPWPVSSGLAPLPTMRLRKAWLLVLLLTLTQLLAAASAEDAQEGERAAGLELIGSASRGVQTLQGPDGVLRSHP